VLFIQLNGYKKNSKINSLRWLWYLQIQKNVMGENISIMWMRTISTVSTGDEFLELMREGIITLDLECT